MKPNGQQLSVAQSQVELVGSQMVPTGQQASELQRHALCASLKP